MLAMGHIPSVPRNSRSGCLAHDVKQVISAWEGRTWARWYSSGLDSLLGRSPIGAAWVRPLDIPSYTGRSRFVFCQSYSLLTSALGVATLARSVLSIPVGRS